MTIVRLACPNCGAPVSPRLTSLVTCAYCRSTLTGLPEAAWASRLEAVEADDRASGPSTVRVAGIRYDVRGCLARGSRADVFWAARRSRLTELVVLKVFRGEVDLVRPAAAREFRTLRTLAGQQTPGSTFFTTLLPQPVAFGSFESDSAPQRVALVYRWRSGFVQTLGAVRSAYPRGVDPRTAVWMWRRILELLGWLHRAGFAHGGVTPDHLLVHPRDHGVVLVGFSCALAADDPARRRDLTATAHAIRQVVEVAALPGSLAALLERTTAADATTLAAEVLHEATAAFGPPTYHPFTLPGWH